MEKEPVSDVLGDSLIPVINKLQDIFSQVRVDGHWQLTPIALRPRLHVQRYG